MEMFHRIKVGDRVISSIDWEMTPELTFGTYESWGGRERVRNNDERIHYFFIDNWGDTPKLCLMERGVKHARVVAEIKAPEELVEQCVKSQGQVAFYDQCFAIDEPIRDWLIEHVLDEGDPSFVIALEDRATVEEMGPVLPVWDGQRGAGDLVVLPAGPAELSDDEVAAVIRRHDFFDTELNPGGGFVNHLHSHDQFTLVDQRTGLMWQRGGIDINSIRTMRKKIDETNEAGFSGYHDWRLPSVEEAMSLLEPQANDKGIFLDPNFSREQPFIFTSARRATGGYWFVDYKQGRVFWSSGTIPGGFGRLCRSLGGAD